MASNIRVVLEVDNKKYISDIRAADAATQKFASNTNNNLKGVNPVVNTLTNAFTNLRTVLAGISFAAAIGNALKYADSIMDVVDASDLSYKSVVGFSNAVQQAGGTFEGAQQGLLKFSDTIGEAISGSDSAQKALASVGLTLKDLQTLSRQEQFDKAVKGLAAIENQALRTKAQMDVFGKSMKGVSAPKVGEGYGPAAEQAAKFERATKAAADAQDNLAKQLKQLQQALVNVLEPLNTIAANINISVGAFESLIKIIISLTATWLIFTKALPLVKTLMDGLAGSVKAGGGLFAYLGTQIKGVISGLVSFVTGIGRAVGLISGGTSAAFSFAAALAGLARGFLRFAGVVGIIYSVVEAINFLSKLIFNFDAVDFLVGKFKNLITVAKEFFGIKPSYSDETAAETQRLANMAKTLEENKKRQEAAAAAAKEFADRQRKLRGEVEQTGDAMAYNNKHRLLDLELEELLIGKTEQQIELFKELDGIYKNAEDAIKSLNDKRKEWAQGTEEQKSSLGIIDAEISRIKKLADTQREAVTEKLEGLNKARAAERMRIQALQQENELENLRAQLLGYSLTEYEKFLQARRQGDFSSKTREEIQQLEDQAVARDKLTQNLTIERGARELNSRLLELETSILGRQFSELEKLEQLKSQNPEAFARKTDAEVNALQQQAKALDETANKFRAAAFARDLLRQGEDFAAGLKEQMNLDSAVGESARRRIQIEIEGRSALTAKLREIQDRYGDEKRLSEELRQQRQKEIDDAVAGINKLTESKKQSVTEDQAIRDSFVFGWDTAYSKYAESAKNAAEQATTYFNTFTRGFEDAIVRFVQTGKLSFKDLANSIIAEFVRIQAKQLALSLFGGGAGGGGGLFGNLFSGIGSIFGFANGGNPAMGKPILVGERGPELMIPRNASTIVPNEMLGGGSQQVNVVYNIQAVDSSSFRSLVARDPEFIYNVTEQGRKGLPGQHRRR